MKNRILCLALVLCLALSLCACGAQNAAASKETQAALNAEGSSLASTLFGDEELDRALALGIGTYSDPEEAIRYRDFFAMLDAVIQRVDESALADWRATFAEAHASAETMKRNEGMVAVYFAAEALGENYRYYNDEADGRKINDAIAAVDDRGAWDEMWESEFPFFPDVTQHTQNGEGSYVNAGYFYSMFRISMWSGKPIFDYDADRASMRPADPLTYAEALRAALRLYDSYHDVGDVSFSADAQEILTKADARREAILNNSDPVKVSGRSYYVSIEGNDLNDGRTPETAWATLGTGDG